MRPLFSIVAAVYDVEQYLGDFIRSVEAQDFDLKRVEIVAVDDGSRDGSASVLEDWSKRYPGPFTLIRKENGGQASARNAGIERATGEWVNFSDPDDMLDHAFLASIASFLERHPDVDMVSARPVVFAEAEDTRREHVRALQYDGGDRVVDLEVEPTVFPGGTNIAFMRLDRLRERRLTFDERLRPVFEDVHLSARYLLGLPKPLVGIVASARYTYRQRASNLSTLQQSWTDPGRYGTVLERGHLDLLNVARATLGRIPEWLQQLMLYDLSWYLLRDERSPHSSLDEEGEARFRSLFEEIASQIDRSVIEGPTTVPLQARWCDLFLHATDDAPWVSSTVTRTKVDADMRLQRLHVRFGGPVPGVEITVDGRLREPAWTKVAARSWFGRTYMSEMILWVASGADTSVAVNGGAVPVKIGSAARRKRGGRRAPGARRTAHLYRGRQALTRTFSAARDRLQAATIRRLARSPLGGRYRAAWVLCDRIDDADDNGERLFEYLLTDRPDVNAWYTVEADSAAWARLRATYGDRLVARGSLQWQILMLNARWLISSHADQVVIDPPQVLKLVPARTWKAAFLGHGITQADLSKWLNRRNFDLIVTTTTAETAAFVQDGSPYLYTGREVRATGMPRYDRLIRLGAATSPANRNLVVIAPTWRKWLVAGVGPDGHRREIDAAIWDSDYLASWMGILRSEALRDAAAAQHLDIVFFPHPNMRTMLPALDLPLHVKARSYADTDVQDLLARTNVMITDYSSVAFDVAVLDRSLVYFQFDRDAFFGGGHIGEAGYFDYERDGFGPVATTIDDAVQAAVEAMARGGPDATYLARIAATFTGRDGRACARVTAAIEELSGAQPTSLRDQP